MKITVLNFLDQAWFNQALTSGHSLFEGQVGVPVPQVFRIPTSSLIKTTFIAVMYSGAFPRLNNKVLYPLWKIQFSLSGALEVTPLLFSCLRCQPINYVSKMLVHLSSQKIGSRLSALTANLNSLQ